MAGGAALAGSALTSCRRSGRERGTKPAIRKFRTLGRTGFRTSDVSLGGLPNDAHVVRYAYDHGINYFDTAESYGNGDAEKRIGEAMAHMDRAKIFITTKLHFEPERTQEELVTQFRQCLERLQTDYADALFMHAVSDVGLITHDGYHAAIEQLKAEGRVKHAGISCHGPRGEEGDSMEKILCTAAEDGRFDLMLFSYNFLNEDEAEAVLASCKERNIGTTAMKTSPGVLQVDPFDPENLTADYQEYVDSVADRGVSREEAIERIRNWVARQEETIDEVRPFAEKYGLETNEQLRATCLQWVLQNEDMQTVCMRIREFEDVDRFVALSGTKLSAASAVFLRDYEAAFGTLYCRHGCTACAASCPHDVPVSTIMRYASYFAHQRREKHAMRKYAKLGQRRAENCLACNAPCTGVCPHGVDTQMTMVRAHALLNLV